MVLCGACLENKQGKVRGAKATASGSAIGLPPYIKMGEDGTESFLAGIESRHLEKGSKY